LIEFLVNFTTKHLTNVYKNTSGENFRQTQSFPQAGSEVYSPTAGRYFRI